MCGNRGAGGRGGTGERVGAHRALETRGASMQRGRRRGSATSCRRRSRTGRCRGRSSGLGEVLGVKAESRVEEAAARLCDGARAEMEGGGGRPEEGDGQ